MIKYDASVIQTFAADLYRRADTIIMVNALIFGVVGGAAGLFAFGKLGAILCAIAGGGIGYYFGAQKAFVLKLQAQTALCQAQIERNTQSAAPSLVSNGRPTLIAGTPATSYQPVTASTAPDGPVGSCPYCDAEVSMSSEMCPSCKTNFSDGGAWKVKPGRPTAIASDVTQGPLGICPSCEAKIALAAQKCPSCKASFSVGSPWKVKPI